MEIEERIDNRQGKQQILSNIKILNNLASYLKTTLGPFGLDKLIINENKFLITNDGATIIKNLNLKHPITKLMESISIAQDDEIGDGTTSVVLLTIEILNSLKEYIEKYDVSIICSYLEEILEFCLKKLADNSLALENILKKENFNEEKILSCVAKTALTSKILKNEKEYFSSLIIKALNISDDIYIKKIKGGSVSDSTVFNGIAFEKCFTYAGYEQQPKKITNAKILLTTVELEWKSERENAEMKIDNVLEYQKIVDAEWEIIKSKLDFIIQTGANVVFSSSPIGDYATQYFARFGIFCSGRVSQTDIKKMAKVFDTKILTGLSSKNTEKKILGECSLFEEKQIGNLRYNYIHYEKAATFILRGPGDEVINEIERSLNDALMVVKKNKNKELRIVTGGGSNEISISLALKNQAMEFETEKMFIFNAVAQALENLVTILANNFGIDSLLTMNKLTKLHNNGYLFSGISTGEEMTGDMKKMEVFEPYQLKANILKNAINAVCTILMIDSTILVRKDKNKMGY